MSNLEQPDRDRACMTCGGRGYIYTVWGIQNCAHIQVVTTASTKPLQPQDSSGNDTDGYDTTLVFDCGDTFRVNQGRGVRFQVGQWFDCPEHSKVESYDPVSGEPEYLRDRKIVKVIPEALPNNNGSGSIETYDAQMKRVELHRANPSEETNQELVAVIDKATHWQQGFKIHKGGSDRYCPACEQHNKAIAKLQALIKSRIVSELEDFVKRVDTRLPDHRNNVEEWKGHNLGLSQARTVMELERDKRIEELQG